MSTSELDSRNIAISMKKSMENLVITSQDAIGQSISQAITFTGVIAQHANQMVENRNISRSPSPSLRNSDGGIDESDKIIESIAVPINAAGDSISICSATDLAKCDPKAPSPVSSRVADGPRTKKKSWYTALYPTYKSKCDDFHRLFRDHDDERLIVDYSCALQKDILAHGRLYASQNYLCFYASIFGWETHLSLRWKDVTSITKEKTALVIPNAILVCTETEKHFLTSFSGRDKAYLMLFRVWQNALMDQPMTSQEIWQWVHSCYGAELGFNSDDEGYPRDLPPPPLDVTSEDLVDSSSMDISGLEREERARSSSRGRDSSPPLVNNGGGGDEARSAGDPPPTDMSDTTDSEPDKHHQNGESEKCTSPHGGKLLMRQQFPFNIDQLFTMIFTNSKFNLELLAARGTTDYVQAPWQPQAGLKCRQVSYVLGLTSGPIGPKEVHVTETQVMNKCSTPGVLYSIDVSSENTGIPYAEYFAVEAHYCLRRANSHATNFAFYGHVRYKKNMWPMVKSFLEKSAMNGLEEFARLLENRLTSEAGAAPTRAARRHRRLTASSVEASVSTVLSPPACRLAARSPPNGGRWLTAILIVLLLINGLLYWRLMHGQRPWTMEDLQHSMNSASDSAMSSWSQLLERHALWQRQEVMTWRRSLSDTVRHLALTEQAIRKLLDTIEPSLEKQRDGDSRSRDVRDTVPPDSRHSPGSSDKRDNSDTLPEVRGEL